jgi:hypothetical protein
MLAAITSYGYRRRLIDFSHLYICPHEMGCC